VESVISEGRKIPPGLLYRAIQLEVVDEQVEKLLNIRGKFQYPPFKLSPYTDLVSRHGNNITARSGYIKSYWLP
jgi:hypothetical protein